MELTSPNKHIKTHIFMEQLSEKTKGRLVRSLDSIEEHTGAGLPTLRRSFTPAAGSSPTPNSKTRQTSQPCSLHTTALHRT